jgi:hypothetical protein
MATAAAVGRLGLFHDIPVGVRSSEDSTPLGVMGLQSVRDVDLIRHACVRRDPATRHWSIFRKKLPRT